MNPSIPSSLLPRGGVYPSPYPAWETHPGLLSSCGLLFGCFLLPWGGASTAKGRHREANGPPRVANGSQKASKTTPRRANQSSKGAQTAAWGGLGHPWGGSWATWGIWPEKDGGQPGFTKPPRPQFRQILLTIFVLNFVVVLMPSWRPSWPQKPAKGRPRRAKSEPKASLGGPCRSLFRLSGA